MASDNRTEAPTPKKRSEARNRGQVARSHEITSVVVLFVALMTLNSLGNGALRQFEAAARRAFQEVAVRNQQPDATLALAGSLISSSVMVIAPLVLAVMVTGIGINYIQVGPIFSTEVIAPDWNRINPLQGMRRMWSGRTLLELFTATLKLSVTGFVAYQVVQERYWMLIGLQSASMEGAIATLGSIILEVGQKCCLALLVMAIADYAYQRYSVESSLKMSKDEIKEEARQSEGDPLVKGKIRQTMRQYATRRMMSNVPKADVVLANPTHFAVALEYKPEKMNAPVVTAKGQDLVAEQVKRVAREHGVPVVETPPLARALYRSTEIGDAIPPALYQAVAEVLAFIYRLRSSEPARSWDAPVEFRPTMMDERDTQWQ